MNFSEHKTMISIIAAVAKNNAIGFQNKLIYWLPNDLKRFKALTTGNTIIMGRKTFESLPKGALPNRRNVVISRNMSLVLEGAEVFHSLEEALSACEGDNIYIIGGEQLYKASLPMADKLCLTEVDDAPAEADAFFPEVDKNVWQEELREDHETDEKHAYRYSFVDYVKK